MYIPLIFKNESLSLCSRWYLSYKALKRFLFKQFHVLEFYKLMFKQITPFAHRGASNSTLFL